MRSRAANHRRHAVSPDGTRLGPPKAMHSPGGGLQRPASAPNTPKARSGLSQSPSPSLPSDIDSGFFRGRAAAGQSPTGDARARGRSHTRGSSSSSSGDSCVPAGRGGGRMQRDDSGRLRCGLPPWVRTISDSMLVVRGGGRVPGVATMPTASLPAVLAPRPERNGGDSRPPPGRGLRASQARLIIPRTISEYFECCRYARSHTGGLLLDTVEPSGTFVEAAKEMPQRAFSEPPRRPMPAPGHADQPPPRIPVAKLQQGARLEGRISRVAGLGAFVDVGATALGLLRWRNCKEVPRRFLRKGEILSNLVVLSVDAERSRFALSLKRVGGFNVEEEPYAEVLERIAGWASVTLPAPLLEAAVEMTEPMEAAAVARAAASRRGSVVFGGRWPRGSRGRAGGKAGRFGGRRSGGLEPPDSGVQPCRTCSSSASTASSNKSPNGKSGRVRLIANGRRAKGVVPNGANGRAPRRWVPRSINEAARLKAADATSSAAHDTP
mmetsp:Transcript_77000/g.214079  ORF Transcript_77000/g.214079 Transcript_77000/m.214079 type:complete len:495 (-) Transcript_77000:227-1711(-)